MGASIFANRWVFEPIDDAYGTVAICARNDASSERGSAWRKKMMSTSSDSSRNHPYAVSMTPRPRCNLEHRNQLLTGGHD